MDKVALKERITHIYNAINLIEKFVDGIAESNFLEDIKLQSAVQYQFLII